MSEHHRLADFGTLAALRALAPDLRILAGADIVPASVLEIFRDATINPHSGLLPRYWGMGATEWSIWYDDPVAVTIHMVDTGIDTRDLLLQESIGVRDGDTLESVRAKQQPASARLLADAARALLDGEPEGTPKPADAGRQHYRMHPELRRRVQGAPRPRRVPAQDNVKPSAADPMLSATDVCELTSMGGSARSAFTDAVKAHAGPGDKPDEGQVAEDVAAPQATGS